VRIELADVSGLRTRCYAETPVDAPGDKALNIADADGRVKSCAEDVGVDELVAEFALGIVPLNEGLVVGHLGVELLEA